MHCNFLTIFQRNFVMDYQLYKFFLICVVCVISIHANPLQGISVETTYDREFPYVASILLTNNYTTDIEKNQVCTGVLITKIYVLTAAHCLYGRSLSDMKIILGTSDLQQGVKFQSNYSITFDEWADRKAIPKKFITNDIALIKLTTMVDKSIAKPVKISDTTNRRLFGKESLIIGWGSDQNEHVSCGSNRFLKKAKVRILDGTQCLDAVNNISHGKLLIPKKYLCSKAESNAFMTCGDSGGPLMINNVVVGINKGVCPLAEADHNLSETVANNNTVNVHASVYFYRRFIYNVIKNH